MLERITVEDAGGGERQRDLTCVILFDGAPAPMPPLMPPPPTPIASPVAPAAAAALRGVIVGTFKTEPSLVCPVAAVASGGVSLLSTGGWKSPMDTSSPKPAMCATHTRGVALRARGSHQTHRFSCELGVSPISNGGAARTQRNCRVDGGSRRTGLKGNSCGQCDSRSSLGAVSVPRETIPLSKRKRGALL